MRKVPTIVLSITYKGVKFIDAANKVSIVERSSFPSLISFSLRFTFFKVSLRSSIVKVFPVAFLNMIISFLANFFFLIVSFSETSQAKSFCSGNQRRILRI